MDNSDRQIKNEDNEDECVSETPIGYTSVPKASLKNFADSIGYPDLTDDVAALIVQDINYKLNEVMNFASQFMKHCGREKLTTWDVDHALLFSDVPAVYGCDSSDPLDFIKDYEMDAFTLEENEIDLVALSTSVTEYETATLPSLTFEWLTFKGRPLSIDDLTKTDTLLLSEVQSKYYSLMTKALQSEPHALSSVALKDLQINPRINPLLPYFIKLITNFIKSSDQDSNQLKNILKMIDSTIRNPFSYFSFDTYIRVLVEFLWLCIKKTNSLDLFLLELQDYAAHLLARILNEFTCPASDIYQRCLSDLSGIISAINNHPLLLHLGTIQTVIYCGPSLICRVLYPHMNSYVVYLSKILRDVSPTSAEKRDTAQRIYYLLLNAAEVILKSYSEPSESESSKVTTDPNCQPTLIENYNSFPFNSAEKDFLINSNSLLSKLYEEFYSYFGDSLIARLSSVNIERVQLSNCTLPLFSDTKQSVSGAELLELIHKKKLAVNSSLKDAVNTSYPYVVEASGSLDTSSMLVTEVTPTKLIIRRVTTKEETRQPGKDKSSSSTRKKKSNKGKDAYSSRDTQLIDKDSSSNSCDTFLKSASCMPSEDSIILRSKYSKKSMYRKLATGNIDDNF